VTVRELAGVLRILQRTAEEIAATLADAATDLDLLAPDEDEPPTT